MGLATGLYLCLKGKDRQSYPQHTERCGWIFVDSTGLQRHGLLPYKVHTGDNQGCGEGGYTEETFGTASQL